MQIIFIKARTEKGLHYLHVTQNRCWKVSEGEAKLSSQEDRKYVYQEMCYWTDLMLMKTWLCAVIQCDWSLSNWDLVIMKYSRGSYSWKPKICLLRPTVLQKALSSSSCFTVGFNEATTYARAEKKTFLGRELPYLSNVIEFRINTITNSKNGCIIGTPSKDNNLPPIICTPRHLTEGTSCTGAKYILRGSYTLLAGLGP